MLDREIDRKTTCAIGAVILVCAVGGFAGYRSYSQKQVDKIVAQREWTTDREKGILLTDAYANLSAQERKQARLAAVEKMEWKGKSPVEGADPAATPTPESNGPVAPAAPGATPTATSAPVATPVPTAAPVPGTAPVAPAAPTPPPAPVVAPALPVAPATPVPAVAPVPAAAATPAAP